MLSMGRTCFRIQTLLSRMMAARRGSPLAIALSRGEFGDERLA